MPLAAEYRYRALEAEALAVQLGPRRGGRWLALARSWRELADKLEGEDTGGGRVIRQGEIRP